MKLSRDFTKYLNWMFDNLIPPVLRDAKWFMRPAIYPLFGKKTKYFMEFKHKSGFMTHQEYTEYYRLLADKHIKRETDLNKASIQFISENLQGEKIMDIACGRGFLANYLAKNNPEKEFTGIDIILPENIKNEKNVFFSTGNIEDLDYPDNCFDTVISTHTIEHVRDINRAISELRRVAKQRLIIVVPKQREYKYTFDLHLHFFPYLFSFQKLMANPDALYKIIDNDIVYVENF